MVTSSNLSGLVKKNTQNLKADPNYPHSITQTTLSQLRSPWLKPLWLKLMLVFGVKEKICLLIVPTLCLEDGTKTCVIGQPGTFQVPIMSNAHLIDAGNKIPVKMSTTCKSSERVFPAGTPECPSTTTASTVG